MPMSHPESRRTIHRRTISISAFARDDGLYDVEAHLVDRKPFPFLRFLQREPVPAGLPLHDLRIRLTLDDGYVVRAIEAASETTPFALCREAEGTFSGLVGERIASGWSSKVKSLLRGAASCTHLMELLITIATPALQGIGGVSKNRTVAADSNTVSRKLDSCYAYSTQGELVRVNWPEHYRGPKFEGEND